jgi:hypothetical protein
MKKIAILAGAALASTLAFAAPASAQTNIEVGRQTLLDNGAAPATLRLNLTGQATATGTHSLTCTLEYVGGAPTGTALEDFTALSIPTNPSANGNANETVSGQVSLQYTGRINPKGMAVGDAVYRGSFDAAAVAAAAPSPLLCPNGATVPNLGFRAAVPGTNGQDAVIGSDAVPAIYGTKKEEVCMAAAQANPHDDLIPGKCPDVPDLNNVIQAPRDAVIGRDAIPATNGTPQIDGVSVTYRYVPSNASFFQSGLTVLVEGQTVTVQ